MFATASIRRFLHKQLFPDKAGERARAAFETHLADTAGRPLLVEADDAAAYAGTLLAGMATGRNVFCCNPRWNPNEWQDARAAITAKNNPYAEGALFIPTGGTGGQIRFVTHTRTTLKAAARTQVEALTGGRQLDTISPLPLWHISGLMPIMRALACGGRLVLCNNSLREERPRLPHNTTESVQQISLVPTQLFRLLTQPGGTHWLRRFDCILLCGAAASESLLASARLAKLRIAIGYGMTETAAFIALYSPGDFATGLPLAGTILPNARVQILDASGNTQPGGVTGHIAIKTSSLTPDAGRHLVTHDEGILENGRLRVLGRMDRFIISGGEKTDPRRVEATLLAVPWVRAVHVSGVPDNEWGQRVAALVEIGSGAPVEWQAELTSIARASLPRHSVPNRWICLPSLPFDGRGKISQTTLARLFA